LQHYRYLIVIDDLWDEPSWDFLNTALIDNHHGSRVIVTTRNLDVGKICTGTVRGATVRGAVYELEPLSDKDSRRLLYTRVFKKEEGINTKLNEVAGKILKKCGGLPLAITTIAGLLASRKTKEEWYAVYNSICSGHVKTKDNMEKMRD
jgi:disease resistance protein RPM1